MVLMSNRLKKQRVSLPMGEKRQVLCHLAVGKAVKTVAEEFGVIARQVYDICSQTEKWQRTANTQEEYEVLQKRRRQKDPLYPMVDIAAYSWFVDQRLQGTPISGPIICAKALKFYDSLYPQLPVGKVPFKASEGWLCRFKDRITVTVTGNRNLCRLPECDIYV